MVVSKENKASPSKKARRMFRIAIRMVSSASRITFTEELKALGFPHLGIRIGLHCGHTFTGAIKGGGQYPKYKFFGACGLSLSLGLSSLATFLSLR